MEYAFHEHGPNKFRSDLEAGYARMLSRKLYNSHLCEHKQHEIVGNILCADAIRLACQKTKQIQVKMP